MRPGRIWLERAAADLPGTRAILSRFAGAPVEEIDSLRDLPAAPRGPFELAIARKRGNAVKPFRGACACGAPEYFLAGALGCPCDCAYCYLQGYLDSRIPTVFGNPDSILEDLEAHLRRAPGSHIHLGHLSDGLLLEPAAGIARGAADLARRFPDSTLEIRTKGARIDALPPDPPGNVIVSWTFSPHALAHLERGTAPARARIAAAGRARERGYAVGIRIDPVIRFPGWRRAYGELAAELLRRLRHGVRDCVIGAFRYAPALERVLRARPDAAPLLHEEFVACRDGKRRYARPLRVEVLRHLAARLGGHYSVSLAMEDESIWRDVFALPPPGADA